MYEPLTVLKRFGGVTIRCPLTPSRGYVMWGPLRGCLHPAWQRITDSGPYGSPLSRARPVLDTHPQNIFSQAIAKAVMALIEATVPFSHTTMGEDGRENCCLVFPLDSTADRFIATPPGETPPPLGVAMFDDKYAPEKRPKFGGVYEENWSYSFSFHVCSHVCARCSASDAGRPTPRARSFGAHALHVGSHCRPLFWRRCLAASRLIARECETGWIH